VAGEEGGCMAIRTDTEKDEIEDGEPSRIFHCKFANEFLLVIIGELFKIVEKTFIYGVDVVLWEICDFGEKDILAELVIGVVVLKLNDSLICVKYLPVQRKLISQKRA
jgi:hypothetical protein